MKRQDETFFKLLKFFGIAFIGAVLLRFIPFEEISIRNKGELELSGQKINIEYARSEEARSQGLSGRSIMDINSGMLFVFPNEETHSFWMKDMLMPLDIIFINKDFTIVDIKESQNPCTPQSCPQILSGQNFKYALEVNSGWVKINNVKIGDKIAGLK